MLETGNITGTTSRRRVAALLATLFLVVFAVRLFDVTQVSAAIVPDACGIENAISVQEKTVSVESAGRTGSGFAILSQKPCHLSSCSGVCTFNRAADDEIDLGQFNNRVSFGKADQDLPAGIIHAAQPKPPRFTS